MVADRKTQHAGGGNGVCARERGKEREKTKETRDSCHVREIKCAPPTERCRSSAFVRAMTGWRSRQDGVGESTNERTRGTY